jgi:ribosome-binding protein aMBF1 (putative translation factor)
MREDKICVEKLIMRAKFEASKKEKSKNKLINIAQKVHIGERLRNARLVMNLTQKELAKQLGKTNVDIARYESGQNLTLDYIITVSKKSNKPLYWFFETDDETKNRETAQEWFNAKMK